MSEIYNISVSNNFVETLAQKLLDDYAANPLALSEALILLPNRRACRSLSEAFVRLNGMNPTLLPQMRAIGDIREDEMLFFSPQLAEEFLQIPPVISPLERTLLLMKLIAGRPLEFGIKQISLAQSCHLAQELGTLLDEVSLQGLNWDTLDRLVPLEYASHWQETLKFLSIITAYWPNILQERFCIDAQTRRNIMMNKQSELWQNSPPDKKIIIAGTTAVSPAMKNLLKTILSLPLGEVYLAGLDKLLDEASWQQIDETHPQFELKQLLDFLELKREQITDLTPPAAPLREKLISEIMRPASTSHIWRQLDGRISNECLDNIHLIECPSIREEAVAIAVLLRQTLETPARTIALVTPDRNLARRVSGELERWGITIDDSAGVPLAQTSWGIFMRSIAETCLNRDSKPEILSLIKHSLLSAHLSQELAAAMAERVDKNLMREKQADTEAQHFLDAINSALNPLVELCQQPQADFADLFQTHLRLAEDLSSTDTIDGSTLLWEGDDGAAAADFVSSLLDNASVIGNINPAEYLELFEALMSGIMVRSTAFSHPRIKILGPLEARLNHYDTIIIGSCNEGIWPASAPSDPWMSRPMKRDFGLNLPEQQIGVTALDFAGLLGAPEVYITRSQMSDGAQTVKSRWLMRLTTVLQAGGLSPQQLNAPLPLKLGHLLDTPNTYVKISPPAPHPPVSARPVKLSASAFEKLLRDPYSVFAEYILKLKPLGELNAELTAADFGNIVHNILDEFARTYPEHLPDDARQILITMGQKAFLCDDITKDKLAFWLPRYQQIIDWILTIEKDYRSQISRIYSEVWGHMYFDNTPMGRFEIYAKADRIDRTVLGSYNIIDYKTGRARQIKEVKGGYAPQLPIEALIADAGGFESLSSGEINSLMYWKLNDKTIVIDSEINTILQKTRDQILTIINLFSFPETGYLSRPNPKHLPEYSDYEHLARVKEWSVSSQGEDN
ncbi:MAG: PD-(D/E)XK nuclease family protein [Alphaproteobacteria bacterium]|nr:PD-(D/E)XK nuclease family protein [Alphaproteobacteria bacterium]